MYTIRATKKIVIPKGLAQNYFSSEVAEPYLVIGFDTIDLGVVVALVVGLLNNEI